MTLPATDAFTDTDAVHIGTHGSWTVVDGQFDIYSNSLAPDDSGLSCAYWNADTFDNNQYSQAIVAAITGSNNIGIAVRIQAAGTNTRKRCA